ncbi:hypothetical protein [Deinococcus hopiensis]|uniref:Uncharacterized protein n=1 Tax=Deinococcus hopiensis KR-140 TaxID=695939 RepID=A0A1W1V7C8_9DEIO|nr:hypothetical protein [Deinococcus hopiensis]SMB89205.1 hypothetical protein SAMN00790413_00308 [Deinococcus hopiensis KR-140]
MIPELHLRRTKRGEPIVTVFGAVIRDGVLTGEALFVASPVRPRTRLQHDGTKYEMPRLERGFFLGKLQVEAV